MNALRLEIELSPCSDPPPYDQMWRGLLFVDGTLLNAEYSVDYMELVKSAIVEGDYYILTCGCGDSGCAGLEEPIRVTHDSGRILWHITDPLPERRFEFSKDDYATSILEFLRRVQAEVPRPKEEWDFPFGYYGFLARHLDWCVTTLDTGVIVGTGYENPDYDA